MAVHSEPDHVLNPGPGPRPRRERRKGQRFSVQETIEVLDLALKGVSQKEIARLTGIQQQQVSAICARHTSTTRTALSVLQANAHNAAVAWVRSFPAAVKKGEHRPMRDALIATGVIQPDATNIGVTVLLGSGVVTEGQQPTRTLLLPELGESSSKPTP